MKLQTRQLASLLLIALSTMILLRGMPRLACAAIATDATTTGASPDISSSAYLNHTNNVMIVIGISIQCNGSPCPTVGSATVGDGRARLIPGAAVSNRIWDRAELWYYYTVSSGNDQVTIRISSSHTHAWGAASFTGARPSSFESTTTNTGYGVPPTGASLTVNSGTPGRRVIQFIGTSKANGGRDISPGLGQTELTDSKIAVSINPGTMEELNYEDTASQVTMTGTINPHGMGDLYWATVATAILAAGSYSSDATETATRTPTQPITELLLPAILLLLSLVLTYAIVRRRNHGVRT